MLRALIAKEWLTSLLELRFLVCAALCVLLGIISVVVLRADLEARRTEFGRNQSLYRDQAAEYGSYRNLQRRGVRVDRPPQSFQVPVLRGGEDPGPHRRGLGGLPARLPGRPEREPRHAAVPRGRTCSSWWPWS